MICSGIRSQVPEISSQGSRIRNSCSGSGIHQLMICIRIRNREQLQRDPLQGSGAAAAAARAAGIREPGAGDQPGTKKRKGFEL